MPLAPSVHNRGDGVATRLSSIDEGSIVRAPSDDSDGGVSQGDFYGEYHGHTTRDLELVHAALRGQDARPVLWLCGDSTLDNKYWLNALHTLPALNGFEAVLKPPRMQPDVAYALNASLARRHEADPRAAPSACAINCAVEESTLGCRQAGLLAQDEFIRDHIQPEDVLVISVGGNDIALRPTLKTIASIAALLASPRSLIKAGLAPGLSHFVRMFREDTRRLVEQLVEKRRPKCVVVCMLYFLDESADSPSWASGVLRMLGYNSDPTKLQLLMRTIFERATCNVGPIEGTTVLPLALFDALDGKDPADYEQRVEPSAQGGRKMAEAILNRLQGVWPEAR